MSSLSVDGESQWKEVLVHDGRTDGWMDGLSEMILRSQNQKCLVDPFLGGDFEVESYMFNKDKKKRSKLN